jgi:hypothetical protein
LEDRVLDQVGGQQRAAAVVECFEDRLGVVAWFQVDDHQLEVLRERHRERL